ncbi:hypothetical protein BDF19DRAFT_422106 [Syncephalis fuscata]|nr:hypothetical protein BDF19DRAFT_422106 [Syncephalis fuscata]
MATEATNVLREDVLKEYEQLALAAEEAMVASMNTQQVTLLTDKLREIERKFASVYAIVKEDIPSSSNLNAITSTSTTAGHYNPSTTNRPAFLHIDTGTNNNESMNTVFYQLRSLLTEFDTHCEGAKEQLDQLKPTLSVYESERQGPLLALNHLDDISQWLEIPQTIDLLIKNEQWDEALALWDQCRYWQQQLNVNTIENRVEYTELASNIYEQVNRLIHNELTQQLLIRLTGEASLPELARLLGRLRRLWSLQPINDILIDSVPVPIQLAAILIKARLRSWQLVVLARHPNIQTINKALITVSPTAMTTTTTTTDNNINMEPLIMERSFNELSQYLDTIRETVPDLHRQLQVLLGTRSNDTGNETSIMTMDGKAIAATYLARQVLDIIMGHLHYINDLASIAKLYSLLLHVGTSLGRYGADPLPMIESTLHERYTMMATTRINTITNSYSDELQKGFDWIPRIKDNNSDHHLLNDKLIPTGYWKVIDSMDGPPSDLLNVPIWAPITLRQSFNQWATIMMDRLLEYEKTATITDKEEGAVHIKSVVVAYYIYLLVPVLWHGLLGEIFGRSSTSESNDDTVEMGLSLDTIELLSRRDLQQILKIK